MPLLPVRVSHCRSFPHQGASLPPGKLPHAFPSCADGANQRTRQQAISTQKQHQNRMIFMDSEHAQFSSSQPESGVPNQQDAADTAPGQNAQPEQSAQAEPSQTEAASANRHRRRRPSRGGSRHNRSSAAEQTDETAESADDLPEATAQNEAPQETEQIQEPASFTRDNPPTGPSQRTEVPGESDAEATGDLESTASVSAPWQPAAEEAPSTMPEERVWGFQRWREQPPTDWNPFIPQSPAAQSQTQSAPQPLSAP